VLKIQDLMGFFSRISINSILLRELIRRYLSQSHAPHFIKGYNDTRSLNDHLTFLRLHTAKLASRQSRKPRF
jgi:hypothetical protein